MFGIADVLLPGMHGYADGMGIYRWPSDAVERGRPLDQEPSGPLVRVVADRVVYTEHWLRRDGYSPRQFWSRSTDTSSREPAGPRTPPSANGPVGSR